MLSGVRFAPPSCADSAMEKHPACAAAISSSGFVPGAFSKRVVKEYGVSFSTPPGAEIAPFPSFKPPFQTALALRCMDLLLVMISLKARTIVDGGRSTRQAGGNCRFMIEKQQGRDLAG